VPDSETPGQRAVEQQKGVRKALLSPVEPSTRFPNVAEKEREISDAKVFKTVKKWQ